MTTPNVNTEIEVAKWTPRQKAHVAAVGALNLAISPLISLVCVFTSPYFACRLAKINHQHKDLLDEKDFKRKECTNDLKLSLTCILPLVNSYVVTREWAQVYVR